MVPLIRHVQCVHPSSVPHLFCFCVRVWYYMLFNCLIILIRLLLCRKITFRTIMHSSLINCEVGDIMGNCIAYSKTVNVYHYLHTKYVGVRTYWTLFFSWAFGTFAMGIKTFHKQYTCIILQIYIWRISLQQCKTRFTLPQK